jgi:hypothetical protein
MVVEEGVVGEVVGEDDEMLLVWGVCEFGDIGDEFNLALKSVVMGIGSEGGLSYKEEGECVKEFVHESD